MKQFCNIAAAALAVVGSTSLQAVDTASRLDSPAATTTLQIIDREMIERSGKFSLAEVLRDLPLNSVGSARPGSDSSRSGSLSDSQGYAGMNLRGLDADRTLVLVDGRREAIAPETSTGSNLNLIPLAMVERIEILPSGAGAVHGMNAIGGVINIITRDDLRGVEASAGTSWTDRAGGEVESASVLAGFGDDSGSIVVGASYDKRDIVFARDRAWSAGGASIFSNNFLDGSGNFLNGQGPLGGPGNVEGCQGDGFSLSVTGLCLYDFTVASADEVQTRNESLFANARYRIAEDWSLALDARASRLQSFQPLAPAPSSPWPAGGFGSIVLQPGSANHPATPPSSGGLNPLWEDYQGVAGAVLLNSHRFAANGARESRTESVAYNVGLELDGTIGRFDVSVSAQRAEIQQFDRFDNVILAELAQAAIDAGAYNLYDPFSTPTELLESFQVTGSRDASSLLRSVRAGVATDLFELPGGTSRALLGVEWRAEDYDDQPDVLQVAGLLTGAGVPRGNAGDRETWAVFGELALPITERLDATSAVRWDDYDFTGSGASARVALDWRPLDRLGVHASWSRSLRAEPLRQQASRFRPIFTTTIFDPQCFNPPGPCSYSIPLFQVRNPDLDPEVAEQIDLGVRYAPWQGVELAVNAFDVQIDERFVFIGSQFLANCLAGVQTNCPDGLRQLDPLATPPDADAGLGVARDANSGRIVYGQSGLVGLGTIETRGLDLRLAGEKRFGAFSVASRIDATWLARYRVNGGADVAGANGFPDWRGRWQTNLDWEDFALTWIVNYVAGQDDSASGFGPLPSWTTHDVQLRWSAPWNADIAVGVDNLADRDPVLDNGEPLGFNYDLYDGYGRLSYFRYTQRF